MYEGKLENFRNSFVEIDRTATPDITAALINIFSFLSFFFNAFGPELRHPI
jgi:hypothetical protein